MDIPCAPTRGRRPCAIAADASGKREFEVLLVVPGHGPGRTSGKEGVEFLTRPQAEYPTLTGKVMTGQKRVEGAVDAMRRGIRDYAEP